MAKGEKTVVANGSKSATLKRAKEGKRIDTYQNEDEDSPIKSLYVDKAAGMGVEVLVTLTNK